jgi:uncharacterized membrane protein
MLHQFFVFYFFLKKSNKKNNKAATEDETLVLRIDELFGEIYIFLFIYYFFVWWSIMRLLGVCLQFCSISSNFIFHM